MNLFRQMEMDPKIIYNWMCVRTRVCVCECVNTCVCVCVNTSVYMYIYETGYA